MLTGEVFSEKNDKFGGNIRMFDGFLRVAAATPDIRVADCSFNGASAAALVSEAYEQGVSLLVLPELCLTGYTCSDLFLQESLLDGAEKALVALTESTRDRNMVVLAGLPLTVNGVLYNVAAVLHGGEILGFVPKSYLPTYSEFYEGRHYHSGADIETEVLFNGRKYPFGTKLLFRCRQMPAFTLGIEICEDLWVAQPPSIGHALAGATVIANLSASDETTGKDIYRKSLVSGQSARLVCGYIYADAGEGESSTDLVFGAHNLICENGSLLAESERFHNQMITADLDTSKLVSERRRMTTWQPNFDQDYRIIDFDLEMHPIKLRRYIDPHPFVPDDQTDRARRCEEILTIQAMGLKKRLAHTHCRHAVVGISGGLDSTLALLVTVRAFDMLDMDRKQIMAVTMPCFGTTDRTYHNACELVHRLGATLEEVDIKEAVTLHFSDIGQDLSKHDVTYENGQARERTQVLMDIANRLGGMVIGTGDMSELALGWATYNGDHMSMYGVNASVPKTLVRHLVRYCADTADSQTLKETLLDILDTPVSPELIPPEDGEISQKTEDLVGPYELHDFFLYHILRFGRHPAKVYRLALQAFEGVYDAATILRWLKIFYRRFFAQQFKRSCLPDGPKVGSVAVSPRGDLRMPSDACAALWMQELDEIVE